MKTRDGRRSLWILILPLTVLLTPACDDDDNEPAAGVERPDGAVDAARDAAPGAADVGVDAPPSTVVDMIPAIKPAPLQVATLTIATGMVSPDYGTAVPELPGQLFVVDQTGPLWRVDLATGDKFIYLDTTPLLVKLGVPMATDERGFLGLAFHPQFAQNGLFYTFTSEPVAGGADYTYPKLGATCPTPPATLDPSHQNVIREWQVADPLNPDSRPDATSRVVLRVDWPNFNHDGGTVAFGPDGLLYISFGDGGGEDDQTCQAGFDGLTTIGHPQVGTGQTSQLIYSKILRIDPTGRTSPNGQYRIPLDNPFVGGQFPPETFAWGLRNTYRFSFDRTTGILIGNDTGQNSIEEVNIVRAGANYGWRVKEGTALFDPGDFAPNSGIVTELSPGSPAGLTDPIAQYGHSNAGVAQGVAGIGGFVYRGSAIPGLQGQYVFGDLGVKSGRVLTVDGRIVGNVVTNPQAATRPVLDLLATPLNIFVLGFAQDAAGELYVLGNSTGTPTGQTGEVLRLVPTGQ
jgi:glucose/arabinose dehydrogenase